MPDQLIISAGSQPGIASLCVAHNASKEGRPVKRGLWIALPQPWTSLVIQCPATQSTHLAFARLLILPLPGLAQTPNGMRCICRTDSMYPMSTTGKVELALCIAQIAWHAMTCTGWGTALRAERRSVLCTIFHPERDPHPFNVVCALDEQVLESHCPRS